MSTITLRAIRKELQKRNRLQPPWVGLVGDANGTIEVPGQSKFWYVRPKGSDLPLIVRGGGAPAIANIEVLVGPDPYRRKRTRILGTHYTDALVGDNQALEPHGSSHLLDGSDPAWIVTAQILNGLVYASTGMIAGVHPGWAIFDGQPVKFLATTIDFTSHIPTGAAYALVRVNSSGVISVQDGTPVTSLADLTTADIPACADGYIPLAIVRLHEGQTALSRTNTSPDITDIRFYPQNGGGGGGTAADITVDTGNFDNNLSAADDTVQKALDTLDDMVASGGASVSDVHWFVDGALATATGVIAWIAPKTLTLGSVYIYCQNKGSANSTTVDINRNGTSVFTTQANRPSLAYNDADGWAKSGTPDVTSITEGDILSLDIDAVATGAVGLTVVINVTGTSGGVSSFFVDLDDVPASYTGQAGKVVKVKGAEDGLEFGTISSSFIGLTDVPASFAGAGGYFVKVNSGATALEFVAPVRLQAIFTISDVLTTSTGALRIGNHTGRTLTIAGVYLDVTTAPTGAAIIVDIHKSGTTIFTTQSNRPQIAASANAGNSTTVENASWTDGQYLTMDVDQIGSTIAGSNLTVTVVYY